MLRLLPSVLFCGFAAAPALAAAAAADLENNLTRAEAERRAGLVSDVHYTLAVQLGADAPEFTGTETVRLAVKTGGQPLALDFAGGQVQALTVNGQAVPQIVYDGHELQLPPSLVKAGANEVTLRFSHPYSANGRGLYRFKDPEDGKVYVYSDFEPNDANRLFPCFDQPDLKATYTLEATAPADWAVVSSTRETKVDAADGGRKTWSFPESAKFSTYLFSLHAGPYHVWEGKAGEIPLRLFARESMAKYVDADFWLKTTGQGLAFYQSYFDVPYAFAKYDQLIVPDFNAGAMENVAAITFSERYLPRGKPTRDDRQGLADTLLHEMAHQWFGDLVTMKWWDDLWLNESFATYMSSLATAGATEFKESAWLAFFGSKRWAYYEDQLVTTHPIEGDVPDTEHAFNNFDGITYGKGASVLKLLSFYVGPEKFRDGVRGYLKGHAFANATLGDFMGSVAKAAGQDLGAWSNAWLKTAGVNTVEARYRCDGGKIRSLSLVQSSAPILRPHRTQVGLYYEAEGGAIKRGQAIPVTYSAASTNVPEAVGAACPTLVFPNDGDFDYARVRLDDRTLAATKTKIAKVDDPLLRMMLWASLWEMVQDGETPVTGFADAVLANTAAEHETKVQQLLANAVVNRRRGAGIMTYLPQTGPKSDVRRGYVRKFEELFTGRIDASPAGSDEQKLWYDAYVRVAESPEAQTRLAGWLDGKTAVPQGLTLDADRRWSAIIQLSIDGLPAAESLRRKEEAQDKSNAGALAALEASAARPVLSVKETWFKDVTKPDSGGRSLAQVKAIMRGLLPVNQPDFRRRFAKPAYAALDANLKSRPHDWLHAFVDNLTPVTCDQASRQELAEFMRGHPELPPIVAKPLRVTAQETDRCIKAQSLVKGTAGHATH